MPSTNTSKNGIATVKSIGAGERKLGETADMIAVAVSETSDINYFDSKVCAAAATAAVWEFVGGQDGAPAQMDKNKNKTDFGRGFGSLVSAVKNRLYVKVETPNYLALAIQAASTAVTKGELTPMAVAEAITFVLSGMEEQDAA